MKYNLREINQYIQTPRERLHLPIFSVYRKPQITQGVKSNYFSPKLTHERENKKEKNEHLMDFTKFK